MDAREQHVGDSRDGIPPNDEPVQGMFDPMTGLDMTGEYHAESVLEMEKKLNELMDTAVARMESGEHLRTIYNELCEKIRRIIENHFRSMKLPADEGLITINEEKLADLLGVLQ